MNDDKLTLHDYYTPVDMTDGDVALPFFDGPFCQWWTSPFSDSDGNLFHTAEHYMMWRKAMLFHDYEVAKEMLAEPSPKEVKAMGRKVIGFDERVWIKYAREIVYAGSILKYSQNESDRNILLDSAGMTLVEASPYDVIWGVGLAVGSKKLLNRRTWNGRNWLGEVLMSARSKLLLDEQSK